ncbi:MAG: hypothetical protein JXR95_14020 [Deltaproteobacteria bacterium]|nr:hypothetical protein [Deltaproteobacteria bacterium]
MFSILISLVIMTNPLQILSGNITPPSSRWVRTSAGQNISGQVVGGVHNARPVYVCRVKSGSSYSAGYVRGRQCNANANGKFLKGMNYDVLTISGNYRWAKIIGLEFASKALRVNTKESFLCQGIYGQGKYTGNFYRGKCYIVVAGKTLAVKPQYLLMKGKKSQWITYSSSLPPHTVYSTSGKAVCRAKYSGLWISGYVTMKKCAVAINGKSALLPSFQILSYDGVNEWKKSSYTRILPYSLPSGSGYVCRASGKYSGNFNGHGCTVYLSGQQKVFTAFELFIVP